MATLQAIYPLDLSLLPTNSVGVLANAASGIITVGKRRLVRIFAKSQLNGTTGQLIGLRVTMGLTGGSTAAVPDSNAVIVTCNQPVMIDMGDVYDQLQVASLSADNGAGAVAYSVVPLVKF